MPDLALNYVYRNSYRNKEACVSITHKKDGSMVDHNGNLITEDCKNYIKFLKKDVFPKINMELKDYRAYDVGLNDQGDRYPSFFVCRRDGAVLGDIDITNITNEMKTALDKLNEKPAFFPKKPKAMDEKKTLLKTYPRY